MKRSKLAAAFSALLMVAGIAPALAADEGGALDKVVDGSLIFTRVGGVGAGLVLGTPVAVVRETVSSYKSMTCNLADKVHGKDCGPACLLVSLVSVPGSIVVGGAKGLYYGGKNGLMKGFNNPFSPDSFSLSQDLEKED